MAGHWGARRDQRRELGRVPLWPAHAGDVELAIRIVGEPLPFLGDDGPLSARLFNLGGRRRGSLGDCMIAAAAIRTGATLATVNTIDFRRFESAGLRLAAG